jgi:plastocyanin
MKHRNVWGVGSRCSGDGGGSTEPRAPGAIAGRVGAGGTDVSAASLTLSGGASGATATSAVGEYRFDNLSGGNHTVTPNDPDQAGVWHGFGLAQGQERSHTFDSPGTYEYHCIPHQAIGMRGTIVVGD